MQKIKCKDFEVQETSISKDAEKMKIKFAEWINNGHNNLSDENTVVLKLKLSSGVLFSHGTRYDIEF